MNDNLTESEWDLYRSVSWKCSWVLSKIAKLLPEVAERTSIPIASLIGKGYDDREIGKVGRTIGMMPQIVAKFSMRDRENLVLRFRPEALPVVRHVADGGLQENRGLDDYGNRFAEAALALKRAFGWMGPVNFDMDFDFESFDHGDDVDYLDEAFQCRDWRMRFGPFDGGVAITPHPRFSGDGLPEAVCVAFACQLVKVPLSEFLDPEVWEERIREIVGKNVREWTRIFPSVPSVPGCPGAIA